jgi:hypothetical protein
VVHDEGWFEPVTDSIAPPRASFAEPIIELYCPEVLEGSAIVIVFGWGQRRRGATLTVRM